MLRLLSIAAAAVLSLTILYCDFNTGALESGGDELSWEEFKSMAIEEPGTGVWIANGDTPFDSLKELREFYDNHFNSSLFHKIKRLIVHTSGGNDVVWSSTQKKNLTYCISKSSFGDKYNTMVSVMNIATKRWEDVTDINFIHVVSQDSNCTKSNNNVVFDVNYAGFAFYVARAFFPDSSRSQRNVIVSSQAFGGGSGNPPIENVVTHELGHAIGLRHEHTRPEAGTCYEDRNWRALTSYDPKSVMHYPQCNGTGNLEMTSKDREGIVQLYGTPGDNPPPPPPPPPAEGDTISKNYVSRTIAKDQTEYFGAYAVVPGSTFKAVTSGSGDTDLYVKFGSQPTKDSYNCRPYKDGTDEDCSIEVPSNVSEAYIMVYGYKESTYQLSLNYLRPKGVSDASDDGDDPPPSNCHEECHEVQNGCDTETVCETVCD